jgi:hypothetical protein
VFAPHYAAPMACVADRTVTVTVERGGGETLAELAPGDAFDVLELAGDRAWGVVAASGLVGYCDRHALVRA